MITKATFVASDWQESKVSESDGVGLSTMADTSTYSGGIDGSSKVLGTICYQPGDVGTFTGYEQVIATVDGKKGSFVLVSEGTFEPAAVRAGVTVLSGSATGELTGLAGTGTMHFAMGAEHGTLELDYTLEAP